MISGITSSLLQEYLSQSSSQNALPSTNAAPAAVTEPAQPQNQAPAQDSIQLSASAISALETPEELFREAAAGNYNAIVIIKEDLTPIPHSLDLLA
jgi:hypothetical protein